MTRASKIRYYPPELWDREAPTWDEFVANPTNPHQFYYYEADLLISQVLNESMNVLELGCGTGGSTEVHCTEVRRLVASDFSKEMIRGALLKFRSKRDANQADFLIADGVNLPFCTSSFDAVISRGVLLSYVSDPVKMLREAHRVLRGGGRIAVDAMNRVKGQRSRVSRFFLMMGDEPTYMETFVRSGRQVRRIFPLPKKSPYIEFSRREKLMEERPRPLLRGIKAEAEYEARLYRPQELGGLLEETGFEDVRIRPLGHLSYAFNSADSGSKEFLSRYRGQLSKLYLLLGRHVRIETALHLFATASRG